ncbi:MAG: ArnT family glycosyltransferase [Haloarculaceae archaeon]
MVSLTLDARSRLRALRERPRLAAALLAVAGGLLVTVLSFVVFPYHSINHDEGVYLQQAELLLSGHLNLFPPVEGAFRPWFFVEAPTTHPGAASRLYPKYAPVPAAVFALGKLLGSARLALGAVAAGVLYLTFAVVREAFDARTGLLAAAFVLASPLFLVDAALFLPYATTALLDLAFAFAYLRADRTGSLVYAALAGAAVGLAFFARPYTAVVFAAPFVCHALWRLRVPTRIRFTRLAPTAALGLGGVALALAYNAAVTGDPLLFPYEAFAPHDGLGFGYREILGHSVVYDLDLALRSNALVLRALLTEWVAAGPLGSALALIGGLLALGSVTSRRREDGHRLVLLGVFAAVALGNVYFWGNYNILGALSVPDDGLVDVLGPYYHFDALLPLSAFAAHASVRAADGLRRLPDRLDVPTYEARAVVAVVLVLAAAVLGGVAVTTAQPPLAENRAVSDQLTHAYDPVEGRDLSDSLVFLPTPYGDWLNHPFQALRNDPGYDDGPVYALPENRFAVVDAFPNRTYYRYVYHGQWSPQTGRPVDARLQPVNAVAGERVVVETTLGVPRGADSVSIRLTSDSDSAYYVVDGTPETATLRLLVDDGEARLRGPVTGVGEGAVAVADRDELELVAFVDYGAGQAFSYRVETPVARENGTVRALTPYTEVCRDPRLCDGEAAYLPGTHGPGVSLNVSVGATDSVQRRQKSSESPMTSPRTPPRARPPRLAAVLDRGPAALVSSGLADPAAPFTPTRQRLVGWSSRL